MFFCPLEPRFLAYSSIILSVIQITGVCFSAILSNFLLSLDLQVSSNLGFLCFKKPISLSVSSTSSSLIAVSSDIFLMERSMCVLFILLFPLVFEDDCAVVMDDDDDDDDDEGDEAGEEA